MFAFYFEEISFHSVRVVERSQTSNNYHYYLFSNSAFNYILLIRVSGSTVFMHNGSQRNIYVDEIFSRIFPFWSSYSCLIFFHCLLEDWHTIIKQIFLILISIKDDFLEFFHESSLMKTSQASKTVFAWCVYNVCIPQSI